MGVNSQQIQDQLVLVAKALSDPIRVRILAILLSDGPGACCGNEEGVCVCDIMSELNMMQSKVSYHLAKLKEAGLVIEEKRGRWNFYAVDKEKASQFIQDFAQCLGVPAE